MKSFVCFVLFLAAVGCGLMLSIDFFTDPNHYADMSLYQYGFIGALMLYLLASAFWPNKNV